MIFYDEIFFYYYLCCVVLEYVSKDFDWLVEYSFCWIYDVSIKFYDDIVFFSCVEVIVVIGDNVKVNFKDIIYL